VGFAPHPEIVDPGGGVALRNEICTGPDPKVGTTAVGLTVGATGVDDAQAAVKPAPATAAQRRPTMSRVLERAETDVVLVPERVASSIT
jgi:hypothetical protein